MRVRYMYIALITRLQYIRSAFVLHIPSYACGGRVVMNKWYIYVITRQVDLRLRLCE